MSKGRSQKKKIDKNFWIPYAAIMPAIILILIFKVWPIGGVILEGFRWKGEFSLKTYKIVFSDATFWKSLWVTIKMNLILTPVQIVISLGLALAVNMKLKGVGAFRMIYYLPATISSAVAAVVWNMMLRPTNGIMNSILNLFHIPSQPFFTSQSQAMACVMAMASWLGCGYWMMFLLAGLQDIDTEMYEAAQIDGAGWWRTTVSVTIPLLKNTLMFVVIADTTSNLLLFAPMYLITGGGPSGSTNVLMYEIYKTMFVYSDNSKASAMMTILMVLIAAVVAFQYAYMNRDGSEKSGRRKRK